VKELHPLDRALIWLIAALIFLASIALVATIFVPSFATTGQGMTTIILGALTGMASILTGRYFMGDARNTATQEEQATANQEAQPTEEDPNVS
jgi:uncharacterized membrane-anchored protein